MPEKLKDIFFSKKFISDLSGSIKDVSPKFDKSEFNKKIYTQDWKEKELKEKMRHTTNCLYDSLPNKYSEALKILKKIAPSFGSFDAMVFPDYVACYGLDNWDLSLPALALFTKHSSSEFAIRPFLERDPTRAMDFMYKWSKDKNHHVRRLASEGCRPRLPWAMALHHFKNDPSPILPVIETLKNDPSEYVRKSVANNLNDISKDHPEVVLDRCERWFGESKNTDWIIKHACRTMLKAGNKRALILFGFGDPKNITINDLSLNSQSINIGDELQFEFDLDLKSKKDCLIRIEYGVDYVKSKGKLSRKIFQLKEGEFSPGKHTLTKKHSFLNRSTRKHYPGQHHISIMVNGVEKAKSSFNIE